MKHWGHHLCFRLFAFFTIMWLKKQHKKYHQYLVIWTIQDRIMERKIHGKYHTIQFQHISVKCSALKGEKCQCNQIGINIRITLQSHWALITIKHSSIHNSTWCHLQTICFTWVNFKFPTKILLRKGGRNIIYVK